MANVRDDLYAAADEVKRDLRYGNSRDNLFGPGQSVGTFAFGFFASGASGPNAKIDGRGRGEISELPTAAADALRATPADGQQHTVTLPELGRYRVVAGTLQHRRDR